MLLEKWKKWLRYTDSFAGYRMPLKTLLWCVLFALIYTFVKK